MAKPNYSFEKRQRELAKRKKKEEKLKGKTERKSATPGDETAGIDDAAQQDGAVAPGQPSAAS